MSQQDRPRVLDVGQCDMDHANISRMLKESFGAIVDRAKSIEQVMYMTGFYDYDLVLVNRIFDADGAEGLDLIRQMKAAENLRETPVMLVSNFEEAQAEAQQAGAIKGFGKNAIGTPETIECITAQLGDNTQ